MIGTPVQALTGRQLDIIANPQLAGANEAVPAILFDTQLYTTGTTTTLQYFRGTQTDDTLSNMTNPGQLPDPQYFQIFNCGFDVLADATTAVGTEVGALDDIQKLMLVGRPVWNLKLSDKDYGNFAPLSFLHTSGGASGFGWGTFTAEESIQYANNSVPDGGWNWYGSVIIPPKVGFSVTVKWGTLPTLSIATVLLRFWFSGVMHRRVL